MNRTLYYILLVIFSVLGAFFMALASMSFADLDTSVSQVTKENHWYKAILPNSGSTVQYFAVTGTGQNVKPDTVVLGDIGRLSSFLYLFETGSTVPPLSFSGKTNIILSDVQGIVSLYDLFSSYTVTSQAGDYRLEQITNGSFYIGRTENGKLVIYSIDGVVRLVFLDKGVEMTSMILFPGSYIRFDPSRNASLKGADLFRIITTLSKKEIEVGTGMDTTDNLDDESFEFMNPRADTVDGSDVFFNSRLPFKTLKLFRVLSARFHAQVQGIDLLKSYENDSLSVQPTDLSSWLLNPSKKNFFMLLELKQLLSQAVKADGDTNNLVSRIATLYENAKSLDMESSSAKKTIEQFLLDGRFALYGDTDTIGSKYQDTYEKIAKMIGIEPTEGKSKLLQDLADIYSGNLFLQSSKISSFRIDTYKPTAEALYATLDSTSIEPKDFFDIAIYVYNILDKVQDKGILPGDQMDNEATYKYLTIFFHAGERYMNSIQDQDKKVDTIISFSSQFYERILSTVVNSLYATFMQDTDGSLYLRDNLLNDSDITMDPKVIGYISNLQNEVSSINDIVKVAYQNSDIGNNSDTFLKIQKDTLRLKGLSDILDTKNHSQIYKTYMASPYVSEVEINDAKTEIVVPKVKADMSGLETLGLQQDDIPMENSKTNENPKTNMDSMIQAARTLFPDANTSSFIQESTSLRVSAAMGYIQKSDGSIAEGLWTLVLSDTNTIFQPFLQYGGRNIEIKFPSDSTDVASFMKFLKTDIKAYLDIIDSNSDIPGNVRIFLASQKINIGDRSFTIQ